jgi:hypothetical protein
MIMIENEKWTPDVLKRWESWSSENDPEKMEAVDETALREAIMNDLAYVSQMDVKEYTLYQKWCEIHTKYPTEKVNTIFGEEGVLKDPMQAQYISEVKENFWFPSEPDDYLKLRPVLELTDDAESLETVGIDGTSVSSKTKRTADKSEKWNTLRTFLSTMKNNSNIGRNLYYMVKDDVTGRYLGTVCISSDFLDLTPRDDFIGWSREKKTQGRMINHTAIGSTIVPTQPLGFNYVGGKLLALLCLSDTVQNHWKEKYGDVLAAVTTTSLYGKTKAGGLSQYDNLDHWKAMGFTSGSVSYEPSLETRRMIINWLKKYHTVKYFEWYVATNPAGQPYKRDHKNRSLNFTYGKFNIPKEYIRSEHARGIYFSPLYDQSCEFLRGEVPESALVKSFDTSTEALAEIWKTKHAKGRIKQLVKKNRVSYETLFYDDLVYLTWEEAKAKYIDQVGR